VAAQHVEPWSSVRFERSVDAAREGSFSALGQLFDHYRDYLLRIANEEIREELAGKVAPSDIVQDAFVHATKAFAQFNGKTEEELRAWLRTILIRNLLDTRKLFQTHKRAIARETSLGDDISVAHIACQGPRPSSVLMATESRIALEKALTRLPDDYRRVLILRSLEERPFEDVGRELDRSAEAARRLWSRAVQMLAMELNG